MNDVFDGRGVRGLNKRGAVELIPRIVVQRIGYFARTGLRQQFGHKIPIAVFGVEGGVFAEPLADLDAHGSVRRLNRFDAVIADIFSADAAASSAVPATVVAHA